MEGSARKELVIASARHKRKFVEISVADTGSGIAPEISSKRSQPFVTTKRQGMGVGLSISHSLVQHHGGQMRAEANTGGGTVLCFSLTRVTSEDLRDGAREIPSCL